MREIKRGGEVWQGEDRKGEGGGRRVEKREEKGRIGAEKGREKRGEGRVEERYHKLEI